MVYTVYRAFHEIRRCGELLEFAPGRKKPERFYLTAVKFSMVTEALTTLEQSGLIDADESRRLRQKFLDARPGFEDALNKLFGGYE